MTIVTLDRQVPKIVCTIRLEEDPTQAKMDLILLVSLLTTTKFSLGKETTE